MRIKKIQNMNVRVPKEEIKTKQNRKWGIFKV